MGFGHTTNLGKYLGFPWLAGGVKKSHFAYILDNINKKLAGWKSKTLNRASRVTLVNSVMLAIPIYTIHNICLPEGICDSIDKFFWNFIWGSPHAHWVKWSTLTQTEKKKEGDKLWVKILKDEYFPNSNLFRVNLKKGSWYMWNCYEQRRRDLGFHVKVTFINYKI